MFNFTTQKIAHPLSFMIVSTKKVIHMLSTVADLEKK